jgi:hypothetical protein
MSWVTHVFRHKNCGEKFKACIIIMEVTLPEKIGIMIVFSFHRINTSEL